ncbi:hypothetical protein RsS62_24260 [Rhizobium dioscoreae]|nr:hypothetical protein RsS62_24260 [Rhizobium dioscoreae]
MSAMDLVPVDNNASQRLAFMLRKTAVETDFGYTLPTGLIAAWVSCGANFQLSYDIHTSTGLDGLTYWWLQHGRYTFPGLADIIDTGLIFDLHFKWINKNSLQSLAVTPLMEIIYRHRPDLSELFDTNEIEGRSGLWQWWLATGHKEYSRSGSESNIDGREALSPIAVLSQITSRSPDDIFEPQFEFVDSVYYQALVAFSRLELDHGDEIAELLDGIHFRHISQCLENRLPTPLMALVYRNRPDLQPIFSLDDKDVDANFWSWWPGNGASEYFPPLDALRIREVLAILSDLGAHGAGFVDTLQYRAFLSLSRIADSESKEIAELLDGIHLRHISQCLENRLPTPLMALVYRNRPDLQPIFSLDDKDVDANFWCWWLGNGASEYFPPLDGLRIREASAILSDLGAHGAGFADTLRYRAFLSLSRTADSESKEIAELLDGIHFRHISQCLENRLPTPLMALVYRNRPDLQPIFSLDDKDVDANFWSWWLANGASEYFPPLDALRIREVLAILSDLGAHGAGFVDTLQYRAFLSLSRTADSESKEIAELLNRVHFRYLRKNPEDTRWTPLMGFVYRNRPDLQNAFPAKEKTSQVDFRKWWNNFAGIEYALKKRPVYDNQPAKDHSLPAEPKSRHTSIALAGYPRGEFGLGEDIRLLRASLQTVGVEPDVIRVPWKITAREGINEQITEADEADFECDVMIYVMPAFDTLTLLNKVGTRAFSARRKIGYWQWELSKFPEPAMMAFDLVDEVWCHSEHSAKAFREATDKPVIRVPLPVQPPAFEHVARSTFNLNESSFIVFTSFDGASSISRKNPMAAILAFQKAFPRSTHPDVQLVVKAMNAFDDGLWRDCIRKSYLDDRIHIRNEVLDRDAYYQLLACCDVVLSMHRAEGFGRLMAEAMAIGVPVISTGYSGNLDFMTEENSWLIPGQICKLVPGDYSFYKGQEWMEPDIDKAAEALRDCLLNSAKRERLIANAKKTLDRYSLQNCGKQYLALIASKN